MRVTTSLLLVAVIGAVSCGCIADEEPETVQEEQELTAYLQGGGLGYLEATGVAFVVDPGTQFEVLMNHGDTIFVAGTVYATYVPAGTGTKVDPLTRIACGPTDEIVDQSLPDNDWYVGTSNGNLYKEYGSAGVGVPQLTKMSATHYTKAIYEYTGGCPICAPEYVTCWLLYRAGGAQNPGDKVRFSTSSYLTYYNPNQFPGKNFTESFNAMLIDSDTTVFTPGGTKYWSAGTDSQNDSEVVVYWSPGLTACRGNDPMGNPDPSCQEDFPIPIPGHYGYNGTGYYKTRITVYQANLDTGLFCNKNFGTWSASTACSWHDHHCDLMPYSRVVPIVTGTGSEGVACGTNREFAVFAQIKKTADTAGYPDIHIKFNEAQTNTLIYSR